MGNSLPDGLSILLVLLQLYSKDNYGVS